MPVTQEIQPTSIIPPHVLHPLEPLTVAELQAAVTIARSSDRFGAGLCFAYVGLHEPPKEKAQQFKPGDPIEREAFICLFDQAKGTVYEAVVSLTTGTVISWQHIPDVRPPLVLELLIQADQTIKNNLDFQAAMAKRGITDMSLVLLDPLPVGNFGLAEEEGRWLVGAVVWVRASPTDNGFARPIEGVRAVVDLNLMQVIRVEDHGVLPVPPHAANYTREFITETRPDLKILEIKQPDGPSFQVEDHAVSWQKWRFRVGFTPREGLVLHTVGYEDKGRVRPILYRASVSELFVPYGDPSPGRFRTHPFDFGEYVIASCVNSLELGCDCLGEIYYFDGLTTDRHGQVKPIRNAICMHEEDYGVLWKHTDWFTGQTEVRRSRRLVVSFFITAGNYDYGFFWYFYQDGTIQFEVKLTGILYTAAIGPGEKPKYGTLVAPQVNALNHQHFFNVRLDLDVDGAPNSVYEVNTETEPIGPNNPYGNAFFATPTLLTTEREAQRLVNPMSARYWKVVNPAMLNHVGLPVGYKLVPGPNVPPFVHAESSHLKRGGFIARHLWATAYHPAERFATGNYINQHPGGEGLPKYTQADRSLVNTDVVLWYTLGSHHLPRTEDWPVMPVEYLGFSLKPDGFFDQNPALDVPLPLSHHACEVHKSSLGL
jgi:primary-amine oxidase